MHLSIILARSHELQIVPKEWQLLAENHLYLLQLYRLVWLVCGSLSQEDAIQKILLCLGSPDWLFLLIGII